jgi:hypothetical protein
MEDKIIIFTVVTAVVIVLILIFTVPAIMRNGKAKANNQEIKQKNR